MGNSVRFLGRSGAIAAIAIAAYLLVGALVHADTAPVITTNIKNASGGTITSAALGASVQAAVQVASSTGPVPQGTVDFNVYNNLSCSGSPASIFGGAALTNGMATSSASVVGANGLSYKVHYNHDANNVDVDGQCTPLSVTSSTTGISTTLSTTSATVLVGSVIHDSATLANVTGNAGGTVRYSVFTDNACQTPFAGAGGKSVTNAVVQDSDNVTFNTPGTYYWQAVYSGDANNSAATSTCTSEVLTVQAIPSTKNNPTISTALSTTSASVLVGSSISDSATLSGATANAGGSVAYKIYGNNSCSTLWADAGTQTVTNASVPNSAPVLFNVAGTFYWQAVYSGDANNNPATSTCTSEVLIVTTVPNTPPPAGSGTISGTVFNDANKNKVRDAGEGGLAGFVIHLYQSANFNGGAYFPIFKTVVSDANGNYAFTGLANGTYSVEQVLKKGWKQTSDDFASVALSGNTGVSGLNFGDVAKKNQKNDCSDKSNRGKGKGHDGKGRDCENQNHEDNHTASSTKPWWKNADNNGLHLGFFLGLGNKHGGHGKDGKDD